MKYTKEQKKLKIFDKSQFNIEHILKCGQIFSFQQKDYGYDVFSKDKYAKVYELLDCYIIETDDVDYFENFFDLKIDYQKIKQKLCDFDIMHIPIKFGYGIRILKQDPFETLISFIISANNNIKRIKNILNNIRREFGEKIDNYYAFPTQKQLLKAKEEDFVRMGAGYRAKYLVKVLREVQQEDLESWRVLSTDKLRNKLISLSGVGPKVADCVLLFGYSKMDVFPVDTWIAKMYNQFYAKEDNKKVIRQNLIMQFDGLSGYAQQYLFFSMRDNKKGV